MVLQKEAKAWYIPPRAAAEVETWVCEDLKEVRGELRKQNCLLDVLHNKISARHQKRLPTRSLDEQLWQVQCAITVLKRRVKQFPEPPPVASVTQVDPCCAEIYEEKQLMATQGMLREDLVDEQRRIALLCWKLRELGVESPRVFGMASLCNSTDSEEATSSSTSADVDENSLLSAEEREWKERCRLEDAARSALLGEIVRLRNECAVLLMSEDLFKKPKKKVQVRKRILEDEGEDEGSRLDDIKELQKAREKKNGLTELECAVGISKAAALEDGIQMTGGGMTMTQKKKAAMEAASIEAGLREQFEKETMLRDEHEELRKYIDEGMKQVRGDGKAPTTSKSVALSSLTPEERESEMLRHVASKLKNHRSEASTELLSEHMLAGIPEVDLGISARITNILETEKKKKFLMEKAIAVAAGLPPPVEETDEPLQKRRRGFQRR
ncbi:unnamed protein product [Caenorhabditis auriculariae]|uniref:Uncharacterized protein n=1 Tax=Caenorhabditis auriculariae TaxID=2777116 RepID=A0A8S1H670_9PELO|nr:unnamed protein product [Caenorhabditis auriculariae]